MKKYWKLIVLLAVVVSVISIFYIDRSLSSSTLPSYSFEKKQGNEEVVESLIINGDFNYSMMDTEQFKISDEGTEYLSNENFFTRLQGYYLSEETERRQKEYRDFMRGKEDSEHFYFENDDYLAYANMKMSFLGFDYTEFVVDVLDKDTNERTSFSVPIPDRGEFWYIDVETVKFVEGKLFLFAKSDLAEETEEIISIHKYTFDIEKQELASHETIETYTIKNNFNGYSEVKLLFSEDPAVESFMAVHFSVNFKEENESTILEETKVLELESFNMKKNEKSSISIDEDYGYPVTFTDTSIYFGEIKGQKLHIKNYEIDEQKIADETVIELQNPGGSSVEMYDNQLIHDGKYYFAAPSYSEGEEVLPTVAVVDLPTMKVDYVGKVTKKGQGEPDVQVGNDFYGSYFGPLELKKN